MNEESEALAAPTGITMQPPSLYALPAMPILAASLAVRRAQGEEAGAPAAVANAI
jgi:hypothetical protein